VCAAIITVNSAVARTIVVVQRGEAVLHEEEAVADLRRL
jgi:hypothetical protein